MGATIVTDAEAYILFWWFNGQTCKRANVPKVYVNHVLYIADLFHISWTRAIIGNGKTDESLQSADVMVCIRKAHSHHSHLNATRMRCAQVGLKCE